MSKKSREHQRERRAESNTGLAENSTPCPQVASEANQFQSIQVRAYALWEQAGRPDCESMKEQFWCNAENQVVAPQAGDRYRTA